LRAQRVEPEGPGAKAGLKQGDVLVSLNEQPVDSTARLTAAMHRAGVWSKATYGLMRQTVPVQVPVILVPLDKSMNAGLRLIALIYLAIGLYVLLRRWTAPRSTHFYLFCLASFVFYAFHYTGKLRHSDLIVYWGNVVAWVLQPALFLHFVMVFPEQKESVRRRPWLPILVYLPAALLLAVHISPSSSSNLPSGCAGTWTGLRCCTWRRCS
jgi:hypothetical protein